MGQRTQQFFERRRLWNVSICEILLLILPRKKLDVDYAQKNFANAKSISSSQIYQENPEDRAMRQSNINRFSGATAISSASYYNRDESRMGPSMSTSVACLTYPQEEEDLTLVQLETGVIWANLAKA